LRTHHLPFRSFQPMMPELQIHSHLPQPRLQDNQSQTEKRTFRRIQVSSGPRQGPECEAVSSSRS
jgi:hypothetical protein